MSDLTKLNTEQQNAVTFGEGPLLIIAGAGTGKTTVVTKRIEHLILEKNISPANILALTFTEKAAKEMETRIDEIMPYGYTTLWIETFHAFCDRILRQEAINIGLNPRFTLMTEAESLLFFRKHLFDFNLQYFRPLGNPTKFLQGILTHFSRLKDDDITPEQYITFAEEVERNPREREADDVQKVTELAHAFQKYEELKAKNGVMDYSDLISNVLTLFRKRPSILKNYQNQFTYVFVDEFQDTNFAQNEMAILLAGNKQNITVVGDDDQCLPGETMVTTPQGDKQIKTIKQGDHVITAVGKGALGISSVNNVFHSAKETIFLTITTKSGAKLTATTNHKMFCYVPKMVKTKKYSYVYLMYRQNLGWRLGTTNDLAVRLKLERSADTIIGLRAFDTEKEARYHELLWSLQYQIPTCIFKEREGVMLQGELVERLYKVIDTEKNAKRLADDLGIDLTSYHHVLGAVTRGKGERIKIVLSQCYRNYTRKKRSSDALMRNPLIAHEVRLETSNPKIKEQLEAHTISYQKAKKGIRVRFSSSDIAKVHAFAIKLANITGGFIQMQSVIGTLKYVNMPALILPAGNLLEGLSVPIMKDHHVFYDEIVTIQREKREEKVYDLEIDKTHNFIANNIVVHNSIYRWRGAAIANMMQFKAHFPKAHIITLTKNYRSTQRILDGAYQAIQQNNPDRLEVKEHIDKHLQAMKGIQGDDVTFLYANRGDEEAEAVAQAINDDIKKTKRPYNHFAILVRANDHALPFQRALERANIPFQFLGPGHLYEQDEIKDLIAYLHVLADYNDTPSLYRVITMPLWSLQGRDIASLLSYAKQMNMPLFEAMEQGQETPLTDDGKEKIQRIMTLIKSHLAKVPREQAGQLLYDFFADSGLLGQYLDPGSAKTEKEAQNIAKFFEKLKSFATNKADASVFAVVDWLDLAMELGESPQSAEIDWSRNDAVNILTIHASKGLEFPVVFVVNLVTQRFPSRDRKEQIPVPTDLIRESLPQGNEGLQEERRLFYVAATRAKDKLFLTASRFYNEGKRERKISPFIGETIGEQAVLAMQKQQARQPLQGEQLSILDIFNTTNSQQEQKSNEETIQKPVIEIPYISYSQLQTYKVCPLHYKLRYLMNLPAPSSPALSYGISVHNTLRDFFQMIQLQQDTTQKQMTDFLKKNWINQGFSSKAHEEQTYEQAETMLNDIAREAIENPPSILALESPFHFSINTLKVGGVIDRIDQLSDGRIEIIDYKTGKNVPTEKKVREDLQLSLYALALAEIHDGTLQKDPQDIILTLYYLEEKKKLSTVRTREALEQAKTAILEQVEAIKQSNFACSHSILCKTCEYAMLCNT